jgi:putative FmdB family regulatory protein
VLPVVARGSAAQVTDPRQLSRPIRRPAPNQKVRDGLDGGRYARAKRLSHSAKMPVYEFVCVECETRFEELVRNGHAPSCINCGSEQLTKLLSTFSTHTGAGEPSVGRVAGAGCCGGSCGCC